MRELLSPRTISARALCLLGIAAVGGIVGCEPTVVVGQWNCVEPDASTASDADWLPWWTGFESQTCDYLRAGGFCYSGGGGSHHTVTAPVHSGNYAEAFTVTAQGSRNQSQVRCVRQGTLPEAAYYGAWYYLPSNATSSGLWNLFHFQGAATPNGIAHGLWDVSLVTGPNGKLTAHVLDFLYTGAPGGNAIDASIPVPIGSWFHLELYLKRAKDRTGEVDLYQDGERVARFTKVITDDSNWGQWFVGNLVDTLNPPESTVYVDDVTIAATLGWTPDQ